MATMFADHPCVDDKNEMLFFQKVLFVCLLLLFVNAKTSQRTKRATDKAMRSVNSTR